MEHRARRLYIASVGSTPFFEPRRLLLHSCLTLPGQEFAYMNQIIRDHAPSNPSFHSIHPSVTTPPQPMPSLENTDPPFASHSPTLRTAKPTLLLLLGSALISPLPIWNRHPVDAYLVCLTIVL